MKNLIGIQILAICLLFSSCDTENTINGSGNLTTESRDVDLFTKVSSQGVFEVTINQSNSQGVEITADDNIMKRVRTKVVNNELQLYLDEEFNYSGITLKANISATGLNGLINSGAGNMDVADVDESGAFSIGNFGSGNITIEGSASSLSINNEGSGNIRAFDFFVDNCSVEIEGSGSLEIHCSETLDIIMEGSGNVYYKGNPSIDTTISGSGRVIDAN